MGWSVLADLVMLVHFAFVAFVVFGGLLVLSRPKLARIHLPALAYGVAIVVFGWTCPLTPLEWKLRSLAGQPGYTGGFLTRYLGTLLPPQEWERIRGRLASLLSLFNAAVYAGAWTRARRAARERTQGQA